jgi:Rrf2 family iron-sulfur cluster assembly transcriptional regulator
MERWVVRLELGRRGEYAVRVALDLARHADGGRRKARDIATATSTPRAYLAHILTMLVDAGLVVSWAGPAGGYSLAGPPASISMLAVLEAADGPLRATECVLRDGACSGDGTTCAAHDVWFRAHSALRQHLADASLADVAEETRSRP